jgi:hypothetical protein
MGTISASIMGGLGNIMFQVANGYSVSVDNEMEFVVDVSNYHGGKYGYGKYKNNIFDKINFESNVKNDICYGEGCFNYQEIPKFSSDTKLIGYFQSEKYFVKNRKKILSLYKPKKDIINKLQNLYGEILKLETCSIHVRRGDYLHLQSYYHPLDIEYYKNASKLLPQNTFFLIFSDGLDWCKENFDFLENKIFVDNLDDFEEIYLMSLCKNNIISNSTFGWWGAWLNKNRNQKVIAPSKWFGPSYSSYNTEDIYCKKWIKI